MFTQDESSNTLQSNAATLLVLPALTAEAGPRGSFILTQKFLDGILEYVRRWPGKVTVALRRAEKPTDHLDRIEVHPVKVPFALKWINDNDDGEQLRALMSASEIVLASLVDRHAPLANQCVTLDVPLVYITEYSEQTRRQIIHAETTNPVVRWRREQWTIRMEREYVQAVRAAAGVQCNGTPTYEVFRHHNAKAFLYFDSRVRKHQLASSSTLAQRTSKMLEGPPLRLAFSGRLAPMKGADHLPLVAAELKKIGVPFTLDICGDGVLMDHIRRDIERLGLRQHVQLRGVLDFQQQLIPFISSSCDLFVCCHRQGDPSCTYLETMSCGVPIVGYNNESFRGVCAQAQTGWITPMNQPTALAARIADLHRHRSALAQGAVDSLAFAARHTFEKTMEVRINHLHSCAGESDIETQGVAA